MPAAGGIAKTPWAARSSIGQRAARDQRVRLAHQLVLVAVIELGEQVAVGIDTGTPTRSQSGRATITGTRAD